MTHHQVATALYFLGLLCVIGPALIALIEGVEAEDEDDDSDLLHWLMGKRLDQIFTMKAIMMVGLLFMSIGVVMGVRQ
jgi:hypothetical protein